MRFLNANDFLKEVIPSPNDILGIQRLTQKGRHTIKPEWQTLIDHTSILILPHVNIILIP